MSTKQKSHVCSCFLHTWELVFAQKVDDFKFRRLIGVQELQKFGSSGVQTLPRPTAIEPGEVNSGYCLNS